MTFKLIEGWTTVALHSATTWVTMLVNAVVAAVGVHWAVLLGALPFLPDWLRWPLAVLVGAVVTVPTIIARITAQPKLQQKVAEKANAG